VQNPNEMLAHAYLSAKGTKPERCSIEVYVPTLQANLEERAGLAQDAVQVLKGL
jgi:hypothetical protein